MRSHRDIRHDRIIDLLKDPHTTGEICAKLDMKYATVNADLKSLMNEGRVYSTGIPRNGAILYASGQAGTALKLVKISSGTIINTTELLQSWRSVDFDMAPQQRHLMRTIFLVILSVFEKAERARSGDKISKEERQPDTE